MFRDEASLLDIFKAGQRIIEFAQGLSRTDLETDAMRAVCNFVSNSDSG